MVPQFIILYPNTTFSPFLSPPCSEQGEGHRQVVQREEWVRFYKSYRHEGGRVRASVGDHSEQSKEAGAFRGRRRVRRVRRGDGREGRGGGQRDGTSWRECDGLTACGRSQELVSQSQSLQLELS